MGETPGVNRRKHSKLAEKNSKVLARRAGLGRALYLLWHRPLAPLQRLRKAGGPIAAFLTARARNEMQAAAAVLPPLPEPGVDSPSVFLLTGAPFWYQTAFCLHSLARSAGKAFRVELYDDGSLQGACRENLLRLGPAIRIHAKAELDGRVAAALPPARFPVLWERRENYPNIRKLIDVHAGSSGWKLVLDSDLLFFRRPDVLLRWLENPGAMLHAVDCEESYGYSRALMETLAGAPIPPLVNVGVCGLRSDALDWEELEAWSRELIKRERTNYYLEQALIAMLAARQRSVIAPAADYITLPGRREVEAPRAVMHHYVAGSKQWYFRAGWRHLPPAG